MYNHGFLKNINCGTAVSLGKRFAPFNHELLNCFNCSSEVGVSSTKMSSYTVRIELHSSLYNPDFETLHRAMEQEGFSKLITSDDGITYHLPRGEYDIYTSKDRSEVLAAAKRAVQKTRDSAEILVTESSGRTWSGLTPKK